MSNKTLIFLNASSIVPTNPKIYNCQCIPFQSCKLQNNSDFTPYFLVRFHCACCISVKWTVSFFALHCIGRHRPQEEKYYSSACFSLFTFYIFCTYSNELCCACVVHLAASFVFPAAAAEELSSWSLFSSLVEAQ